MHTIPYAAWFALMSLVGSVAPGAAPAEVALSECEPPSCFPITHNLLMTPLVASVTEGQVVEWRSGGGHHWFVESSDRGGCLSFALSPEHAAYRLTFVIESGNLFGVHKLADGSLVAVPCTGAIELPNGMFLLRYSCALHGRAGGLGLILVTPLVDVGAPLGTLA